MLQAVQGPVTVLGRLLLVTILFMRSTHDEHSHVIARSQSRCTEAGQRCNDLS